MSEQEPLELVLPAPRRLSVVFAALAVLVAWFLLVLDGLPGWGLLPLLFALFSARVVYLAMYVLFGHEVVRADEATLLSDRRVFGLVTRRRRFDIADIESVHYDPPSLGDRVMKFNSERGFGEGSVVVMYQGKPRRIAEGIAHDDPHAERIAQLVQSKVSLFQQVVAQSAGYSVAGSD